MFLFVFDINTESNLNDALKKSDVVIIVTNHKEFYKIDPILFSKMKNNVVIDTRGILNPKDIHNSTIIYRSIGHV